MTSKIALILLLFATIVACNNNDDDYSTIDIEGIIFNGDIECCTPIEAFKVDSFIKLQKIVPELTLSIDGETDRYEIQAYTATGTFQVGYNEIFFIAKKRSTGNFIKDFYISNITPLMHMTEMDMYHSTPTSGVASNFDDKPIALQRSWVSFIMPSGNAGSWDLSYNANILGYTNSLKNAQLKDVASQPEGEKWVQSFKANNKTYYISLINTNLWQVGTNIISAYVSVQSDDPTTLYKLATETFTIDIDPQSTNGTSANNKPLTPNANRLYSGSISLSSAGHWRIHLTVRDAEGNIVAGGDNLTDGHSSLYWDITL